MKVGERIEEKMVFKIGDVLGKGNYGVVYKAVQEGVGRELAIKELRDRESSVEKLKQEAWINGALIHPNIVTVLLFDEGKSLVVMEHVGNSLEKKIQAYNERGMRFDASQVVEMLTQCLEALSYAHTHGCHFHGDIKPANILITDDGKYKISDFGVSSTYKSAPSDLAGSETCAAPEVLKRWEESQVWSGDQSSDLWSLGVVAFLMLTGVNPFVDPTGFRKTVALIRDPNYVPRFPPGIDPNLGSLGRIILKLLAKETGKRYGSARDAIDDLQGLSQQPSIDTAPRVETSIPIKQIQLEVSREPEKISEHNSEELQRIAYLYNQNGEYESGEKFSTESIAGDPKNLYAFQTRGFSRSNLGKYPEAVSDFTTAIQLCPPENSYKLGQLYYHRAYAEGMMGDMPKACEDIRQALGFDPTNTKYQYFRSRFCKE